MSNTVIPLDDVNNKNENNMITAASVTQPASKLNVNLYATKKTISQGMLDIALLTANAAQLKHVLQSGGKHQFYIGMLWLISLSIVLQILAGVGQLVLVSVNINHQHRHRVADIANNVVTILVFVITVINIIISAFGIEDTGARPEFAPSSPTPL